MDTRLLIVGDELLTGKRVDRHLPHLVGVLAARGVTPVEIRFVGDDEAVIAQAVSDAVTAGARLLSCGGIGATPDDVTRPASARALGVPLVAHAEGLAILEERFGIELNAHRRRLVEFPAGALLIPNPVNRIPGFSVGDLHFVPGFPEMAWPMLDWVLDHRCPDLATIGRVTEYRLVARGSRASEGVLMDAMQGTLATYPDLKLSSLPHRGDPATGLGAHIEFGFRGVESVAAAAYRDFMVRAGREEEIEFSDLDPPPDGPP